MILTSADPEPFRFDGPLPQTAPTPLGTIPFDVPAPFPVVDPSRPAWLVRAALACEARFTVPPGPYWHEIMPDTPLDCSGWFRAMDEGRPGTR